nr:hypothetical protein [Streptomyces tsukubensis NRRL18488]
MLRRSGSVRRPEPDRPRRGAIPEPGPGTRAAVEGGDTIRWPRAAGSTLPAARPGIRFTGAAGPDPRTRRARSTDRAGRPDGRIAVSPGP